MIACTDSFHQISMELEINGTELQFIRLHKKSNSRESHRKFHTASLSKYAKFKQHFFVLENRTGNFKWEIVQNIENFRMNSLEGR